MTALLKNACPECGADMILRWSEKYQRDFYGCTRFPACYATHGAHPDGTPLGTPADKETKTARIAAHTHFDRLWKDVANAYPDAKSEDFEKLRRTARFRAYTWLSAQLHIPFEDAHIGRFDKAMCGRVVRLCKCVEARDIRAWWKVTHGKKRGRQDNEQRARALQERAKAIA